MIKNLQEIVENFKFKKIGVIGDLMLDRTERGIISTRKNPENPKIPIILAREEFYLGGCGNVAMNLSSFNSKVDIYGIIGKDLYGYQIKKICKEKGINLKYILEDNYPTILKARIFIEGEYKYRSDLGEIDKNYEKNLKKIGKKEHQKIFTNFKKEINNYDCVILSDYNKRILTDELSQNIISLANSKNIPVICDGKPENIDYFKRCFAICPNREEAEKMSKIKYDGKKEKLEKIAEKISNEKEIKNVIITCGKEGVFVYNYKKNLKIPANAKKVVDVTGAGDTFTALFSLGIVSGLDIFESAEIANFASGIVVEKLGTSATNPKELIERINELNKE